MFFFPVVTRSLCGGPAVSVEAVVIGVSWETA
jgi:hypothetical protein